MALPKRIRRQMESEGQTLDDVAEEIETGRVTLSASEDDAEQNTVVDDVENAPTDDDDDDIDPNMALDEESENPLKASDGDDAEVKTETDAKADTKADAAEGEAEDSETDETKSSPEQYINPFDVGLEDVTAPQQPAPQQQQPAPQQQQAPQQQAPQQQAPQQQPASQQQAPQQQQQPASQQQQNARLDPKQVLTQAEIAMLGGERQAQVFLHMVQRLAIDPVSRVQQTVEQQQATVHGERVRNFRANIAASVPRYREVITSHAWQRYLKEYSPYTGTSIEEALIMADSRFDERAVLGIFQGFVSRYDNTKTPAEPEKRATNRPKPAELAVPGKSAVSNSTERQGKRYKFKESYVKKLDDDRRRKKISSDEYQVKVAEYEKALRQGKVKLGA